MKAHVVVWKVRVATDASTLAHFWTRLDPSEQQRALEFRTDADRRRFVAARSSRRELLGNHLGVDPTALAFTANRFGKPALARHASVHFNSSHSGDWVLHAISSDCEVGIDVEAFGAAPVRVEDYASALTDAELRWLKGLDPALRSAKFAALWTSKEAYVKALGQGLSRDLRRIEVGVETSGAMHVRHDDNPADSTLPCALMSLDMGPGYAACLACLGPMPEVVMRSFQGGDRGRGLKPADRVGGPIACAGGN